MTTRSQFLVPFWLGNPIKDPRGVIAGIIGGYFFWRSSPKGLRLSLNLNVSCPEAKHWDLDKHLAIPPTIPNLPLGYQEEINMISPVNWNGLNPKPGRRPRTEAEVDAEHHTVEYINTLLSCFLTNTRGSFSWRSILSLCCTNFAQAPYCVLWCNLLKYISVTRRLFQMSCGNTW